MPSGNPVLRDSTFESLPLVAGERMTLQGTTNKTLLTWLILVAAASVTWQQAYQQQGTVGLLMGAGVLGGFIIAMVTVFKKEWAPVTAPLYAALEGLALGGLSAFINAAYPGLPFQAVALTFGTLLMMLLAYSSGALRATPQFTRGVLAATGAVALLYLVEFVLGFFGVQVPMIHQSGTIGIVFSLVVVGIAALNLILDFAVIEDGVRSGAPKYMEWYGAFALMVTMVWLYLEILDLLRKLNSRD